MTPVAAAPPTKGIEEFFMNRRQFLGSSAAALVSPTLSASGAALAGSGQTTPSPAVKKLPIGVFEPPFKSLSLDEMLDKFSTMGIEAVEVSAGGKTGSSHCPRTELLADPAKARAWKKKFDDRGIPVMTLSCHNNPLYPDQAKAAESIRQFRETVQLAGMLGIKTVVTFSGCPGGSPTDTVPNWVVYDWPDEHGEALRWQWKEKVIPYWTETAKFAREHGVHQIALEMHPNFVVFNPRTLLKLREAAGEEIGANCDLSHLFWQQCNAVEVIRFLGKQGAIYHAHMKDTAFFQQNVDRYGVLNFGKKDDMEASEFFRAVGYGHSASAWKDIIAAYLEIGYDGMLSIENEDPLLSGEVGVQRSLATLKNVREELLAGEPNPGAKRG
jgi:sugar phosphate isomerase/epimerase